MSLTGDELVQILGVLPNGQPSSTTTTATTQDIANLGGGGGGDVNGPASSVNNHLAVFDGVTGKLLKDSGPILYVSGPASAIDSHFAVFDGVTGKLVKDGGAKSLDTLTDAKAGALYTFLGTASGAAFTFGDFSTGAGSSALANLEDGTRNSAFGFAAGFTVVHGLNNTLLGTNADVLNDSVNNGTAVGRAAIVNASDTVQLGNTSVTDVWCGDGTAKIHADGSLLTNLPPSGATDLDGLSDCATDYPNNSMFVGLDAGFSNAGAQFVTVLGAEAAVNLTTGNSSTVVGSNAGGTIVTAVDNTIIGANADIQNDTITNCIVIGKGVQGTQSNSVQLGNFDTTDVFFSNSTAVLHGDGSVLSNISLDTLTDAITDYPNGNMALGDQAGSALAGATGTTAVGQSASHNLVSGNANTSYGKLAGFTQTSGQEQTALGFGALYYNVSSNFNTGVGSDALLNCTGPSNTAVGHQTGWGIVSGSFNTFIGDVSNATGDLSNSTALGANATVTASNTVQLGDTAITDVYCGNGTAIIHADGSALTGIFHYSIAESNIVPSGSPFVYQNLDGYDEDIITSGGTVTNIEFSRDGATYYTTGLIAGIVNLSPNDYIRVTYAVAPTMTKVPR